MVCTCLSFSISLDDKVFLRSYYNVYFAASCIFGRKLQRSTERVISISVVSVLATTIYKCSKLLEMSMVQEQNLITFKSVRKSSFPDLHRNFVSTDLFTILVLLSLARQTISVPPNSN